jgi:hypothetical protein
VVAALGRRSVTTRTATSSGCFAASAPLGLVAGASADDLRRALEGKELASALWSACTTADHSPNAQPQLDRENHHERLGSCTKKGVVMASQITLTDQEARAFLAARPGQ